VNCKLLVSLLLLAVCLVSCNSSDAVATFARDSAQLLDRGTAVFDDMPATVLRRDCAANLENRQFDFKPDAQACITDAAERDNFEVASRERDALVAMQKVLIDYFTALQQLAAFGKANENLDKVKGDASKAGTAAAHLASTHRLSSSDQTAAVTGLAGIVVRAFSAGYTSRQLSRDIAAAGKALPTVTAALIHVVQTDYIFDPDATAPHSLLDLEANRMRREYQNADSGRADTPGTRLLLRISWSDRTAQLMARNTTARSYVEALEKIQSGHEQLVARSARLKTPELAAALEPYISSLESLIAKIQKTI
jgi:hypothetical protein